MTAGFRRCKGIVEIVYLGDTLVASMLICNKGRSSDHVEGGHHVLEEFLADGMSLARLALQRVLLVPEARVIVRCLATRCRVLFEMTVTTG